MKYSSGNIISGICGIFLGFFVMIASIRLHLGTPMEPQPGFFPFIASILLICLCISLLLKAIFNSNQQKIVIGNLKKPLILVIALSVYSVLINFIGYLISTVILSIIILNVLDTKGWLKIIIISLLLSSGTYFLFDLLLDVSLPKGIILNFL